MNMQRIKRLLKKVFCLPPVLTVLIAVPAYGLVIYALTGEHVDPAVVYGSYILSAYGLIITVTGAVAAIRFVRHGLKDHPLVKKVVGISLVDRYLREGRFRAEAALYQGFLVSLFYAGLKLLSGIFYRSAWFITLAVYYILLAAMRFALIHYVRKEKGGQEAMASQWKRYRLCGTLLLFMNAALAGMVILVVHENSGFEYPGMLIYVMAMYAFYAAVTAVRNVIKFRSREGPILSAAKVISLSAALVSMLALETAMIARFGAAEEEDFRQIMTMCTGAGISAMVLGMALYMIVHGTKNLKREETGR